MAEDTAPVEEPKENEEEEVVEDEIIEDDNSNDDEVVEEEDETPDEPVKEETPKEEPFDKEEFKRQTVNEAQKAVMDKLLVGLGITKEEEKEVKDELVPPWEKRGERAPKSWKEHAEYAAELSQWKMKKEEEEIKKVQKENEREAKEQNKRWNDYWDSELDDLVKTGKLPEVKDENDPNDPGKKARVNLFTKMKEIGTKRQAEGKPPITSLKLVYYEHYKDSEPAGADAPVSFGKKGVGSPADDDPGYTYADIHGKSVDQIRSGK